jgi:hypothetical protein
LREEFKRIAVEHELQEERERARRRAEQEERERIPPTEATHGPEPVPPVQVVGGPVVRCVVPALKGHSLGAARRALKRAHCALGQVVRPRDPGRSLVVVRQSRRRGTKLRAGATVAIALGRPRR